MAHGLALPGDVDDVSVEASPLVLLNACDSYLRRSEGQERVIGTLLGAVRGNVVVLKNSYAVPHNESEEQVRRMRNETHHGTKTDVIDAGRNGEKTYATPTDVDVTADGRRLTRRMRRFRWPWTSISIAPCSSSTNA